MKPGRRHDPYSQRHDPYAPRRLRPGRNPLAGILLSLLLVLAYTLFTKSEEQPVELASPTALTTISVELPPGPIATPQLVELSTREQIDIHSELWQILNSEYLYPDFNGLDWSGMYDENAALIEKGMDTADFYQLMDSTLFSLGDDHSVFLDPQQVQQENLTYVGANEYVGIGIVTGVIPERQRLVVYLVYPDSPADQAGLRMHDSILLVNDQPAMDDSGEVTEALLGLPGEEVTLLVHTLGEEPRQVTLPRAEISGHLPVPSHLYTSPGGQRIGYILLSTFTEYGMDKQVEQALLDMSQEAPLDGLILDNRINEGGYDDVAGSILRFFVDGVVGHFVNRQGREPFKVWQHEVAGSGELPLVVLVGPQTYSFGEIFSGILADQGRAYLIGETTDGNVETLWQYDFWDGSQAWIAHDTFEPVNHPDADWEQSGIIPDQQVPSEWDLFTLEDDPAVAAALSYFDQR